MGRSRFAARFGRTALLFRLARSLWASRLHPRGWRRRRLARGARPPSRLRSCLASFPSYRVPSRVHRGRLLVHGAARAVVVVVVVVGVLADCDVRKGGVAGGRWGGRLVNGPVLAGPPHHPLPGLHDEAALGHEGGAVDGGHQRVGPAVLATHHLVQDLPLALSRARRHPGVRLGRRRTSDVLAG